MSDITERLALQPEDIGGPSRMDMLRERIEAKAEIDRLRARVADTDGAITILGFQNAEPRARVAELEAERDAAFKMSRCECDSEEACANLAALHRRVAELEAARGEPVAWLVDFPEEPDLGQIFCTGKSRADGARNRPLYTAPPAPAVDVDSISDEALMRGCDLIFRQAEREPSDIDNMRAALRAIFNKGE